MLSFWKLFYITVTAGLTRKILAPKGMTEIHMGSFALTEKQEQSSSYTYIFRDVFLDITTCTQRNSLNKKKEEKKRHFQHRWHYGGSHVCGFTYFGFWWTEEAFSS